jgi:hypothetical protein
VAAAVASLAETTRRERALETRLSEEERALETRLSELQPTASDPPPSEPLAALVIDRARDVARELPEHMIHDAETDRVVLEKTKQQEIETARARSAEIIGAARRDREEVAAMVDEARQQIDLFRLQASDGARKRIQRRWEDTTVAFTEVELELAGLRARRQIVFAKLAQLEESIEESRAQLRERGAAEPAEPSASGPEHRPWAVIPIEW